MKKYVTFFVSVAINYLISVIKIKYLVYILLLFTSTFYCLSNDILWERVATIDDSYFPLRNCTFSNNGEYIITLGEYWICVYNSSDGIPFKNYYIKNITKWEDTRFVWVFTNKENNAISCYTSDSIYTFSVPELEIIERKKHIVWEMLDLSSDWSMTACFYYDSVTGFGHHSFRVYDNQTREIIYQDTAYTLNENGGISLIQFTKDCKYLVVKSGNTSIFDIQNKKMVWHDNFANGNNGFSISPDSKYISIIAYDTIFVYDFILDKLINKFPNPVNIGYINSAFTSDSKYISLLYNDNNVSIYNIVTGQLIKRFDFSGFVNKIPDTSYSNSIMLYEQQFSEDDSKLLLISTESYYLVDLNSGELISTISPHAGNSFDGYSGIVKFANNDEYLITLGPDKTVIWDSQSGKFIKAFNLGKKAEYSNTIAIYPDTKHLIYDSDNKIYIYNIVDEVLADEIEVKRNVLQLDVSTNGKYIGYTMVDSSFAIYDLEVGRVIYSRKENFTGYHEKDIRFYSISFSADSLCAITCIGGDKWLGYSYYTNIYNFFEDKKINEFSEGYPIEFLFSDTVALSWAPNSYPTRLLKYSAKFRQFITQEEYFQEGIKSLAISKNGTHFVTTGPTIWNIETGDSIQLHADPEINDMDYVAVSDNGKMLAAMSPEGRIVVWDVEKYLTPVEEKPITEKNALSIYPNPTENTINLRYRIETAGIANIYLTDVLGNQTLLKNEYKFPGDYVETFNMNVYPQGIYNINLKTDGKQFSNKFLLLK